MLKRKTKFRKKQVSCKTFSEMDYIPGIDPDGRKRTKARKPPKFDPRKLLKLMNSEHSPVKPGQYSIQCSQPHLNLDELTHLEECEFTANTPQKKAPQTSAIYKNTPNRTKLIRDLLVDIETKSTATGIVNKRVNDSLGIYILASKAGTEFVQVPDPLLNAHFSSPLPQCALGPIETFITLDQIKQVRKEQREKKKKGVSPRMPDQNAVMGISAQKLAKHAKLIDENEEQIKFQWLHLIGHQFKGDQDEEENAQIPENLVLGTKAANAFMTPLEAALHTTLKLLYLERIFSEQKDHACLLLAKKILRAKELDSTLNPDEILETQKEAILKLKANYKKSKKAHKRDKVIKKLQHFLTKTLLSSWGDWQTLLHSKSRLYLRNQFHPKGSHDNPVVEPPTLYLNITPKFVSGYEKIRLAQSICFQIKNGPKNQWTRRLTIHLNALRISNTCASLNQHLQLLLGRLFNPINIKTSLDNLARVPNHVDFHQDPLLLNGPLASKNPKKKKNTCSRSLSFDDDTLSPIQPPAIVPAFSAQKSQPVICANKRTKKIRIRRKKNKSST